ncbi:glycosyltransferase [uncultured Microbacterium sp.]|uniref:glycosyltransferase n=1 Tax=uncultured Microbacterium sp. TaxID=191216 RepID=UPI003459AC3B
MRILVDVMGNPRESGGMNLYARELLLAWAESFPEDELHVVGGPWIREVFIDSPVVVSHVVRGGSVVHRFWTQAVWSGIIGRRHRCDALLSLSSLGAFTFPRARTAVIVHDWRHLRRPNEFSRSQRVYRRLWQHSVARAGLVIAISSKTRDETLEFAAPSHLEVVLNGNDHPRRWAPAPPRVKSGPLVLTYGHFVNKRAETVIEAIALLDRDAKFEGGRLVIVGARGQYRDSLLTLSREEGVTDHVELPGFIPDSEYQDLLQQSDVVVLNSSDEGYGLPVSEANYFSVPVIGAMDSGLVEIHGDRVIAAEPTPHGVAAALSEQLGAGPLAARSLHTWADCSGQIRRLLRGT